MSGQLDYACKFLHRELRRATYRASTEILYLSELENISASTFRLACKLLGVVSSRHPATNDWVMSLPARVEPPKSWTVMPGAIVASYRATLGLTQSQLALMLGWDGVRRGQYASDVESDRRQLTHAQQRLLEAYVAGYRPNDWPTDDTLDGLV